VRNMRIIYWIGLVASLLIPVRAIVLIIANALTDGAFGKEQAILAALGLVGGWIAWVCYKTVLQPGRRPPSRKRPGDPPSN